MNRPTASYAWGDRVRLRCGATGRYMDQGYGLAVSGQDNDLFVDLVDPDGEPPHPTLPVPSDDALSGALAAWEARPRADRARERAETWAAVNKAGQP